MTYSPVRITNIFPLLVFCSVCIISPLFGQYSTHEDPNLGIALEYPESWHLFSLRDQVMLSTDENRDGAYMAIAGGLASHLYETTGITELNDLWQMLAGRASGEGSLVGPESVLVGTVPGIGGHYTSNEKEREDIYVVLSDRMIYFIAVHYRNEADMRSFGSAMMRVIGSLQFGLPMDPMRMLERLGRPRTKADFIEAVRDDDREIAELYLESGIDPNTRSTDGTPALGIAAQSGLAGMIEALLIGGADVDEPDRRSVTPLMHAAANGYAGVAKQLLASGAVSDLRTPEGATAFSLAAFNGRDRVVELLDSIRQTGRLKAEGGPESPIGLHEGVPRQGQVNEGMSYYSMPTEPGSLYTIKVSHTTGAITLRWDGNPSSEGEPITVSLGMGLANEELVFRASTDVSRFSVDGKYSGKGASYVISAFGADR
jgi:hypothetical protein